MYVCACVRVHSYVYTDGHLALEGCDVGRPTAAVQERRGSERAQARIGLGMEASSVVGHGGQAEHELGQQKAENELCIVTTTTTTKQSDCIASQRSHPKPTTPQASVSLSDCIAPHSDCIAPHVHDYFRRTLCTRKVEH